MSSLISVIIPARNEIFLEKTIRSLLEKARGEIEIIPVLDGYWCNVNEIVDDKRVNYLHFAQGRGMREAINAGVRMARGEYILKLDAHCLMDEGFDLKLLNEVFEYSNRLEIDQHGSDNWMVIPRRKRLDADNWCIQDVGKPDVDYEFLSSPSDDGAKGNVWTARTLDRLNNPEYNIDENMTFQGSCYFCTKNHYENRLGGMSEEGYGSFVREAQEIGLKTWLGGGKVYINKLTWYAHLHKGKKYGRMYFLNKKEIESGNAYCDDFWFNNRWDGAKHDLAWFIERFMPVPTWTTELINQVRK